MFKKAPKPVQFVPCPTCGQPMSPQVAVMVEQAGTKKRRLPTRRRPSRSNVARFEAAVQPIAMEQNPSWRDRQPVLEVGQPENAAPLSPGETRKSFVYQKWDFGDLLKAFGLALLSGTMFGLSSLIIFIPARAKWYWPVGCFVVPTLVVWTIKAIDLIGGDSTIVSESQVARPQEPAPIIQEPPAVEIVIKSADGKTQRRPKLWAPHSNHAGLWQYADALVRETAAPSYAGGEHVLGAKAFGYSPREFNGPRGDEWRPAAIAGGILELDPHKSKGYRVTEVGKRALARVAEHRLGEWG